MSLNELRFFERILWFLHVFSGFTGTLLPVGKMFSSFNQGCICLSKVTIFAYGQTGAGKYLDSDFPQLCFVKVLFRDVGKQ